MQHIFNPLNFGFTWTADNWYNFDHEAAHKEALKARNAMARKLRKEGHKVSCFSLPNQLVSRGGIGSGHPHIELVINSYGLNAYKIKENKLSLMLEAVPNPDYQGGSRASVTSPLKVVPVETMAEAILLYTQFLRANDLGAGNLTKRSGSVHDSEGTKLFKISYNGRVWASDGTEIKPPN